MNTLQRFTGKTVVVTGASSGIGEETARRFSAEGANVVVAARRRERLDALVEELGAERTLAVTTDVTRREDLEATMRVAAERFGGIDVLVSNAGNALLKPFEETTTEDWHRMMAVNADSCFFGAQAALPYLKQSRGSIVQIGSASGLGGDRRLTAFNAAKGAVVNFTRGLAFDLGPFGIRVNTVAPALTLPIELAKTGQFNELIKRSSERQALAGHSTPADIAGAVTFLASEDARFITGVILAVDGGTTAASGQPDYF